MKIACVGWGSLIWDPRELKVQREWFMDGPLLPIEFSRQSDNGRITLVIDPESKSVRTLWNLMTTNTVKDARDSLHQREGGSIINIHSLNINDKAIGDTRNVILKWLQAKSLDAVVWTGLSAKFSGENGRRPNPEELINYLSHLPFDKFQLAKEYVCKAPLQIDTTYRRLIEENLGWLPE